MRKMLEDLRTIPPFDDLSEDILRLVEPMFERFTCPAGAVIFEQGEPAMYLYLLLSGSVTLRYKPYDGPTINLTQVAVGGVFGWSAVVGNPSYTSGTVAKEDVETIRIRGSKLRGLVVHHPAAGRVILDKLAGKVSNRWKDANRQVRDILEEAISAEKEKGTKVMATPRDPAKEIQPPLGGGMIAVQVFPGIFKAQPLHNQPIPAKLGGHFFFQPVVGKQDNFQTGIQEGGHYRGLQEINDSQAVVSADKYFFW